MTVRAADRRPTIMKVLLLADELLLQAVRLGGNAKCVPKHHQWAFREPLRDAAFAIAFPLYRANELDVVAHALWARSHKATREMERWLRTM